MTKKFAVMGHPVDHSLSPAIHYAFAKQFGLKIEYEKIDPGLDGLESALTAFREQGGCGVSVTLPFKQALHRLADQCTPTADIAGAANTLWWNDRGQLYADNTDGLGLVTDLVRNAGFKLQGRRILLIGAGGAAAGVLGPLLTEKPLSIWVANRSVDKAIQLAARHASLAASEGVDCRAFGLVINASSSSLNNAALPIPASVLQANGLACDLMYGPAAQAFMEWALTHGTEARDGLGMLVEQAAASFHLWRGVQPPTQQVLADLRALISPSQ